MKEEIALEVFNPLDNHIDYTGHDVKFTNIIKKFILAIAKETIFMGRYPDASASYFSYSDYF